MQEFHFPNWINRFLAITGICVVLAGGYLATCLFAAIHPTTVNVGHAPKQPVPYSHKLHVGKLKLDCRYCHNTVDQTAHAAIPPTATCGNCHGANRVKKDEEGNPVALSVVFPDSEALQPVRTSLETGDPIQWVRVHDVPDFVYFNHSAHVNRGVSCVSCHGRVDKMDVVTQVEPMSMKWCLDCHRNPDEHIRPAEFVTHLDWNPEGEELDSIFVDTLKKNYAKIDTDQSGDVTIEEATKFYENAWDCDTDRNGLITEEEFVNGVQGVTRANLGKLLRGINSINPSTNCSTCHR